MKTTTKTKLIIVCALLSAFSVQPGGFAQGTAFTYQGQLQNNGSLASGTYNLTFTLFATNSGGSPVAGPVTNSGIAISNGLFTVTVDFGAGVWNGATNWLEIAVETNGGNSFTTLSPRQRVTPAPYAITAENLDGTVAGGGLSGTYGNQITLSNAANQFTGTFTGNGGGLTGVWLTGGNNVAPGANLLGATNAQPLIFIVAGQQAQRLEPTSDTPNVVGGYSGNSVAGGLPGGTIGGGGTVLPFNGHAQPNTINSNGYYGTISGGYNNQVGGYGGVIGGGSVNVAGGDFSVVSGGQFNTNSGSSATIGGGIQNTCAGGADTIGGGQLNSSSQGWNNTLGGGYKNAISNSVAYASLGGGAQNTIQSSLYATVGGGSFNSSLATGATIGGGVSNSAAGTYATVPGGLSNVAIGNNSFAAGSNAKAQNSGSFVWADSQAADFVSQRDNEVRFRCQGGVTFGSGVVGINQYVYWVPNNGGWSFASDRHLKDGFSPIDPEAVLDKVASLPVMEWSYKGSCQRHIGPMAQDFHALFPLNEDDKMLNECDLHGVALAAIQGLDRKLQAQAAELALKQTQIDQLQSRLDELEKLVRRSGDNRIH